MTVQSTHESERRSRDPEIATHLHRRPVRALESFEQFYRDEYRPVVGLAYALSGSRIAAEDIAQDAFVAAHKDWERVGRYERPGAWVRLVVANLSASFLRTKAREARAPARLKPRSSFIPHMPADHEEFWKAVRSLPNRQARAVALHYLEDRPVAEIPEIPGCSEVAVTMKNGTGERFVFDFTWTSS